MRCHVYLYRISQLAGFGNQEGLVQAEARTLGTNCLHESVCVYGYVLV